MGKGGSGREMVEGVSEKKVSRKSQGEGRDLLISFGMYVCVRVLLIHTCACVCEGRRFTHF